MSPEAVIRILREGLLLILLLSGVPLLVAFLTGFFSSLLQAATGMQEQTLSYVPKFFGVLLTLAVAGPWMLSEIIRFTRLLFESISAIR